MPGENDVHPFGFSGSLGGDDLIRVVCLVLSMGYQPFEFLARRRADGSMFDQSLQQARPIRSLFFHGHIANCVNREDRLYSTSRVSLRLSRMSDRRGISSIVRSRGPKSARPVHRRVTIRAPRGLPPLVGEARLCKLRPPRGAVFVRPAGFSLLIQWNYVKSPHRREEFIGQLIIIGGAEDKFNERHILRRFLAMAGGPEASILIVPVASDFPELAADVYTRVFRTLGAANVSTLHVSSRAEALDVDAHGTLDGVTGVFISGGDQARLGPTLGGTPFIALLEERVLGGLLLGGSSAGAAGMSSSMIVRGESSEGPSLDSIRLAPGLGILHNIIIDQHFTQRHRLSRLITAVCCNPGNLGIGIDEDTAIVVSRGVIDVVGAGTVTIVDGSSIGFTDLAEGPASRQFAATDLRLHILNDKLRFDLANRRPIEYLSDFD